MQQLIESGAIVVWLLVFVVLEVAALCVYWLLTRRGLSPGTVVLNVGAGVALMLALGAALAQKNWQTIAALLLLALVFHVADLIHRWPRENSGVA